MYSEKVAQKRIEVVEKHLKIKLKHLPVGKVDELRAHLEALLNDKGELTRALSQEEVEFIRNERLMCKCSFRYWADRYAVMQKDGTVGGGVGRVRFWSSQELALKKMGEVEDVQWEMFRKGEAVDGICVVMHKARQLGACCVAGTKVLRGDFTWVAIEDIKIGDKVVGVDEYVVGGKGHARKMRMAEVLGTCTMYAPTWKITLSDGTTFHTTLHHKFIFRRRGGHDLQWREAQDVRVGDQIRRFSQVWGPPTVEDSWFGGLLDGEGSLRFKRSGGAELTVCQVPGVVLDRAHAYLKSIGVDYRIDVDDRIGGASSKLGSKPVHKLVVSRLGDIFRVLGKTQPTRFRDLQWFQGKEIPNNNGDVWAHVVKSEESMVQRVFDIQTTTATYIAEGYISHNTALSRIILCHRETNYRHIRGMAASVDDDKIMELYDRDKLCINSLPFYLKPEIGYDVKGEHIYFDKLDSRMLYQQSRQQSGLGQGRQFDIAHLTECAFWPYPNMIELDFFPTLPLGINTLCILESTANGLGGWWYDFTEDVRKGLQRRWKYIFAPWYIETKKNRATPPTDWTPSDLTMKHARRVYETSRVYTGRDVLLEKEQLYWYETERDAARRRGKLNLFLTNFCATPEESFQHTGASQFSVDVLERIRLGVVVPNFYEVQVTNGT